MQTSDQFVFDERIIYIIMPAAKRESLDPVGVRQRKQGIFKIIVSVLTAEKNIEAEFIVIIRPVVSTGIALPMRTAQTSWPS